MLVRSGFGLNVWPPLVKLVALLLQTGDHIDMTECATNSDLFISVNVSDRCGWKWSMISALPMTATLYLQQLLSYGASHGSSLNMSCLSLICRQVTLISSLTHRVARTVRCCYRECILNNLLTCQDMRRKKKSENLKQILFVLELTPWWHDCVKMTDLYFD